MTNKKKKLITSFVMILFASLFFACGGQKDNNMVRPSFEMSRNTESMNAQKELLASIEEHGIYAYAHFIEGKTLRHDYGSFVGDVNIYLETNENEPIFLYERSLARSEFKFYFGKFFSDRDHLILVDYEHGGAGGGYEFITVFDADTYAIIPREESNIYYEQTDEMDLIVKTNKKHIKLHIPYNQLLKTQAFRHGNSFIIENGKLVEYFYHNIDFLDSNRAPFEDYYQACFRRVYSLNTGEVCVDQIDFMTDRAYYHDDDHDDE